MAGGSPSLQGEGQGALLQQPGQGLQLLQLGPPKRTGLLAALLLGTCDCPQQHTPSMPPQLLAQAIGSLSRGPAASRTPRLGRTDWWLWGWRGGGCLKPARLGQSRGCFQPSPMSCDAGQMPTPPPLHSSESRAGGSRGPEPAQPAPTISRQVPLSPQHWRTGVWQPSCAPPPQLLQASCGGIFQQAHGCGPDQLHPAALQVSEVPGLCLLPPSASTEAPLALANSFLPFLPPWVVSTCTRRLQNKATHESGLNEKSPLGTCRVLLPSVEVTSA